MTRRRWRTVSILVLLCLVKDKHSRLAEAQTALGQASFQVFVSATTKNRVPAIPDASVLTASIDKQPAQVLSVRPAKGDKLLFAVMVDMSSSEASKEKVLKDAVIKIFQGLTNNQSQGYLVLFNVQAYASKRPLQPSEVQAELERVRFSGGTSLYDSIAQVASGVLRSQSADAQRRVLIVISDGEDNYSHLRMDEMEEAAERESLPIFSLAERKSEGSEKGSDVLETVAKDTGGTAVLVNKLPEGVPALISAVQGQLALSIALQQVSSGKVHTLSIKTSEKGISIAAPAHILIP